VLGCAVIAPSVPNLREILVNDQNALLFDPETTDSFSHALLRLCRDPDLRARIGAAASRSILEKGLTWENNAKRVVALFEKLELKQEARNQR